jgi:hypothetical protein
MPTNYYDYIHNSFNDIPSTIGQKRVGCKLTKDFFYRRHVTAADSQPNTELLSFIVEHSTPIKQFEIDL